MSSTKILLVDDDDTYLFLTSKILEHIFSECEITTCLNGQEAIDFLEKGSPDVIFLDINMPVMNGWEFLAELEKKNMDLEYPVFIVTSSIA
ncbi:MAG: response regulator, partial [Bacteroidota bacterium]